MVKDFGRETYVNSNVVHQCFCGVRISPWRLDVFGATQINEGATFLFEFISIGVTAEIVVVLNDQYARIRSNFFAEKMRRRKTA